MPVFLYFKVLSVASCRGVAPQTATSHELCGLLLRLKLVVNSAIVTLHVG